MRFVRDLGIVLRQRGFRRLFAVRLCSQFTDGIFHVALAAYILFSPERAPGATAIAAGFAVLLLPFSVLGPFCGVFIDRWSRRQILVWSNLVRVVMLLVLAAFVAADSTGLWFFVVALAGVSVNRFLLAALSASLPHVVPRRELVMANAVSPTCGTLSYLGGFAAVSALEIVARPLVAEPNLAVLGVAAVGYVGAGVLALRLGRRQLGPDLDDARPIVRDAVRRVVRGLVAGARHVASRRPAAYGLGAIAVHRFFYGTSTVATILLYRNYFRPDDVTGALAGTTTAILVAGLGYGGAALVTPVAAARMSKETWIVVLLVVGAFGQLVLGGWYTEPGILAAAFVLGLSAQGIKICVDTLVQENVDDVFRGRVFSFYDVLFNAVFVASAAFAAAVLPATGKSYPLLALGATVYLLAAYGYLRLTAKQHTPRPKTEVGRKRVR